MSLESDVESLLKEMAKKLENSAECDKCGDDHVSISGRQNTAREYARKIVQLVGNRVGRV
jgi:hypothetical protein